jgi:alginate O-acetyltransferase complex protein AlgI
MLAIIVGWVLFRAETFDEAWVLLNHMAFVLPPEPKAPGFWEHVTHQQLFFGVLGIIAATPAARFLVTRVITDRSTNVRRRTEEGGMVQTATDLTFVLTLISICAVYVASGTYNPFIYFRF